MDIQERVEMAQEDCNLAYQNLILEVALMCGEEFHSAVRNLVIEKNPSLNSMSGDSCMTKLMWLISESAKLEAISAMVDKQP